MDREHLDRLGVGLEPPRALLLALVAIGIGDALGEPAAQRGDPELLGARGLMQQLREVAQVGQPALAVAAASTRAARSSPTVIVSSSEATPRSRRIRLQR